GAMGITGEAIAPMGRSYGVGQIEAVRPSGCRARLPMGWWDNTRPTTGSAPMTASPVECLPAFAFLESPLDRAEHLRDDADVLAARWPRGRVVVVDAEGRAAADAGGTPLRLDGADIAPAPGDAPLFLGLRGAEAWFAVRADALAAGMPAAGIARWVDLRTAAATWPAFEATAFAQARAVLHWQARHRHCGACGTALEYRRAGWLGWCARCGLEHYPRTDPAVIVAITDGSRLLLGRNAGWPPHRYSTLAGFV